MTEMMAAASSLKFPHLRTRGRLGAAHPHLLELGLQSTMQFSLRVILSKTSTDSGINVPFHTVMLLSDTSLKSPLTLPSTSRVTFLQLSHSSCKALWKTHPKT